MHNKRRKDPNVHLTGDCFGINVISLLFSEAESFVRFGKRDCYKAEVFSTARNNEEIFLVELHRFAILTKCVFQIQCLQMFTNLNLQ